MSEKSLRWWQPEVFAEKRQFLEKRHKLMRALRRFFDDQDFYEVETPALQVSPGLEPHLMAFKTTLQGPHPDEQKELYLHTSPEFTMKKLLAAGLPKIWQCSHVWRNGERSDTHHPEFSMLEWYRADAPYTQLMQDCIGLVQSCAKACEIQKVHFDGHDCDLFGDWEVLTVCEAFQRYAGINLLDSLQDAHNPDAAILAKQAKEIGIRTADSDSWDDIFFRISFEKIEPHLGVGKPTFLTDWPISMAALSQPKQDDPRFAERFELYLATVELANAFGELTDADIQLQRFQADMTLKQDLYGYQYPIDMDFIDAVALMPAASGIALGIDRLAMLLSGASKIDQVLWAPVAKP